MEPTPVCQTTPISKKSYLTKTRRSTNINDYHEVLPLWEDLKAIMAKTEIDLENFYGPSKNKRAGVRARKKFRKMIKVLGDLRKRVNKQREDYESQY